MEHSLLNDERCLWKLGITDFGGGKWCVTLALLEHPKMWKPKLLIEMKVEGKMYARFSLSFYSVHSLHWLKHRSVFPDKSPGSTHFCLWFQSLGARQTSSSSPWFTLISVNGSNSHTGDFIPHNKIIVTIAYPLVSCISNETSKMHLYSDSFQQSNYLSSL